MLESAVMATEDFADPSRTARQLSVRRRRSMLVATALAVGLYVFARIDRSVVERFGSAVASFHDLVNWAPRKPSSLSASAQRVTGDVKAIASGATVTVLTAEVLGYTGSEEWYGVGIHDKSFDDAALGRLADRHGDRIGGLILENTSVTDAGLAQLAKFPALRNLEIRNDVSWSASGSASGMITDAGMAHLKGLVRLQSLNVSYSSVTDAGLEALGELRELQSLYLGFSRVRGPGLEKLESLKRLSFLSLDGCKLDAEGLKVLAGATALRRLSVSHASLPLGALPLLKSIPGLVELDLTGCEFGEADLADLKKSKPGLKVERR